MKPSHEGVKSSASLADLLATLSWGGHAYPAYSGKCEDAGAGAGVGAGAGDGGAGSSAATGATGASPASGATGSASPAGAAAPATEGGAASADGAVDWKTAPEHFRKAYETQKAQLERFAPFKDVEPDALSTAHATHQRMYDESLQLAEELGYEDAETVAAFHKDPVKLLSFLRSKKVEADAGGPADANGREGEGEGADQTKTLEKLLNQRLKPFEQERAARMAETANNLFRTTVNDLIAADYKGEDALPPKLQTVLSNMVSDRLKSNPQAIHRLVNEGKTSDLQKMYSEAKAALLDIFGEMSSYDKARVERAAKAGGGKPPAGARDGNRKVSANTEPAPATGGRGRSKFDQVADALITDPGKVNSRYANK